MSDDESPWAGARHTERSQYADDCARSAGLAMELALWSRVNRLVLSRIKVGDVELDIAADLTLASQAPSIANPVSQADAYEQYGGPALRRILSEEKDEAVTSEVLEE